MDHKSAAYQLYTVDLVLDGRVSSSPEYESLLDDICAMPKWFKGGPSHMEMLQTVAASRPGPLMAELHRALVEDERDWDRHCLRYGLHAQRRAEPAARRIKKALAA